MAEESIVDASKPNAGRMYDYYLGGNHNFEVDRQVADQVLKLLPFSTKYVRLQRWALQDIAVQLTGKYDFDVIIDFASGLPTNDHIHRKVAEGTTVIYSDFDPVTVQYAREILGNTPNVHMFENDAHRPEDLLTQIEVQKILAGRRKIAFVYWGVSAFLDDEEIAHAAQHLYDWADPGSCWVFNLQGGNRDDPAMQKVTEIYHGFGSKFKVRTLEEGHDLVQPWSLDQDGWIPLLDWHGLEESELTEQDAVSFGAIGGSYGAYLFKP